ncbi:zygote arrest protein 1 isoform X1 [Phalacrocorax carbo]|uniref:zygote arrest protein 1 isoform X1 n=1 Tax=Phalacrocorax carbo TaxID=9209 RepID=UPI00311A14FA
MAEEGMESYLYAAYHPYPYRYPPPKGKGGPAGGWRPRGSGYFSGYGEAAAAAEYFDNYQRAQLKAILSQVNPNLTPRLRKANTKEVGVQVNPRQDASVQCSLGPRTLLRRRPGAPAAPRPREAELEQEQGSPATTSTRAVRFPRTIAVYSPVASRRLTAFLEEPEPRPQQQQQEEAAAATAAAVEEEPAALREQREAEEAAVRASWEKPPEVGAEPLEQRPAATPDPPAAGPEESREEEAPAAGAARAEPVAAPQKREPAAGKTRLRFQFLEQKYGYYHCKDCNIRWESAYVWCVQGTNKVYFRQFCRTCQKSYNPYRVEDITCQVRDPALSCPAPSRTHRPPPSPPELQADEVHLPREDAPRGSQEAPPPGPLWEVQRETPLLRQHV